MRRRINAHESLSDCTANPHHYLSVYDGQVALSDPPMVLRDDALWDELLGAQARLREVEQRVMAACTMEPLDEFEVECGQLLWEMLNPGRFRLPEFDRIQAALVEHAKETP